MGVVISVSQSKGGSTKTTTAVNLCGALLEKGYRAVVADMDKDKPDAVNWARQRDGLNFIIELFDDKPMDRIEQLKNSYDFVILDTPPNYMPAAFKAIILSDFVILPCSPSFLDQNNLADAVSIPRMAKKPFRVLGTKVQKRQILSEQLLKELKNSELAFDTYVTSKTAMLESQFKGQWVGSYKPGCDNHREFLALVDEILNLIELQTLFHRDVLVSEKNLVSCDENQLEQDGSAIECEVIEEQAMSSYTDTDEVAQNMVWENGSNNRSGARSE